MLRRFLWLIHLVCAILLVISAHVRLISPIDFLPAAYLSLAFMILVLINTGFLLLWVFRWSRKALYTIGFLLLSFPTLGRYIQLSLLPMSVTDENRSLKVMSYNVRVFDLYNWSSNKESRDKMLDVIREEMPDVICIQEFYNSGEPGFFTTRDTLLQILSPADEHIYYTASREKQKWGIATFSRWPVISRGKVSLPEGWNNTCIYTDILKGGDTIRVYNVHLASVGLGKTDYQILDHLKNEKDEQEVERTKNVLNRLGLAFKRRASQAEVVKNHMNNSPYRVILSGDFNDTPASYTYQTLRSKLKDAFVERGSGLGVTYTKFFPAFRIDFIFSDPAIRVIRFKTIRKEYSDHYPVVAEFEMP